MKKIPTLFLREFEHHRVKSILPEVTTGMDWVLKGEGIATVKWDGSCCAIIEGKFYRRYDAKNGKKIPSGAIPSMDAPDPVTGHFPCWVECSKENPADKWYIDAWNHTADRSDATYEAIGPQFQKNPYKLEKNILIKHGIDVVEVERTFDGIRTFLERNDIEGLVFWKDGEPQCKIKRKDFNFKWG